MKKLIYILLFSLLSTTVMAQNKLTNAVYFLKNNELSKAKELIDAAAIDSNFINNPATWYYKGNIYKELFKEKEYDNKQSPYRLKAVEAFQKTIALDTTKTLTNSSHQNLRFLAETMYNHAATSFTVTEYPIAISDYNQYKEIMALAYPETKFEEKDVLFNLALANTYGKIAETDSASKGLYIRKSKETYEKVLAIDSNNVSANYNLGILFYNQGVQIIQNMDYTLDLEQLNEVQDRTIALFKNSLPYMLKAYELNPEKEEALIGLRGIYKSLNDDVKSNFYRDALEKLKEKHNQLDSPKDEDSPKR